MSQKFGPLFKPQNEGFFVFTNIGANSKFTDSDKSNNTVQMTGDIWEGFRMAQPENSQELLDAKGLLVMAFENTDASNPGTMLIDASFVAKTGYKSPEGTRAFFAVGSDPAFYKPDDYNGSEVIANNASTDSKIGLIGTSWKKTSVSGSEFDFKIAEFREEAEELGLSRELVFDMYTTEVDGQSVAVILDKSVAVELNATQIVNDYVNTSDPYDVMRPIFDFRGENLQIATVTEGEAFDMDNLVDPDTGQGAYVEGNDVADEIDGSDYSDGIVAGGGDDDLDGGAGADRIEGGEGNDIIKGGADGRTILTDESGNPLTEANGDPMYDPNETVFDYGDRAKFKGKKSDYSISQNSDGTFTVTDNNTGDGLDEGTDTISGIEILEFDDQEMLLVVESFTNTFTDEWGLSDGEDFAFGTNFDDVITGTDNFSMLHGEGGNDVLIGDEGNNNKGSGDHLEGGAGNDFIDGALRGDSFQPWENDNVAMYMGAGRRFTVEKVVYSSSSYSRFDSDGNRILNQNDKSYVDSIVSAGMNAAISLIANQTYFVVTDSLADADGGLGTDILTNIDQIMFDDSQMRLSVFKDPWGGFIEGTDFSDTIQGEGVSEMVEAGDGDDVVLGGDGADRANLGKGTDFFDGGGDTENFDANDYLATQFSDMAAEDFGSFDPNAFMDMMDDTGGMPAGDMMGGMGDMGMGDMGGTAGGDMYMEEDHHHGGGGHHGGGPSGDTVEYRGDFDRYDIKTYTTDSSGNNTELAAIISANSAFSSVTLQSDTAYTVVTDGSSNSKKNTGVDLLVNVEFIQFNDFHFNLSVVQDIWWGDGSSWNPGEVNWRGTFGDDEINFNDAKATGSYTADDIPDRDFMYGEAGNDVMIAGAGGDRLIGGTGNDIMDGGANGTSEFGDEWLINDVAEYNASIDRFELTKHTFTKSAMAIKDANGTTVFTVTPTTKGTETLGEVKRAGETKAILKVGEGETFFVVSDTLPEVYGGSGTDILLGMEQAQFGFDWDGMVNFQVKYHVHSYDYYDNFLGRDVVSGEVNAEGTIFGDTINLIAGKAATDTGGFGGFDDYNTGASIFDDGFWDQADTMMQDMVAGFDIWNWSPGPDDTATESVASIESFYTGEAAFTPSDGGNFEIYEIVDGSATRYLAWDPVGEYVFDEVVPNSGAGGYKIGGAAYSGASADEGPVVTAGEWMPDPAVDTAVASGVSVAFEDGGTSEPIYDIYQLPSDFDTTQSFVAYDTMMGWVDFKVEQVGDTWTQKFDASQYEGFDDHSTDGGADGNFFDVSMWMPGSGDSIDQSVDTVYIPAFADYGISEEAITDAELGINFDIYTVNNGKEDINIARHEGWLINYEVELRDGKWYQVFETGSQGGLASGGGGATGANRIHDSFINAGRGNDVVLAGQGRDVIEGGRGDDFIDGGSESDFLAGLSALTVGGDAVKRMIENPDTGVKALFAVYKDTDYNANNVLWAWDENQSNPTYFKVSGNATDGFAPVIQSSIGAEFYNDRFSQYDEAIYAGSKARYTISEVYLKMEFGQPDFDTNGNYQVKSTTEFAALTDATEKAKWTKVVQVKDVLPDSAGGTGTDYLLNVEEARFEDGKEQLEIDSFNWAQMEEVHANYSWTPGNSQSPLETIDSYTAVAWDGSTETRDWSQWQVYDYGQTLSDGTTLYALWEGDGTYGWMSGLVTVSSGTAGVDATYAAAQEVKYSGSFRGTIKDDVIGHVKTSTSFQKVQTDEIFGRAGNDIVVAGAAIDRIKGGEGNDTIWGGTHEGGRDWQFKGDTAFFSGSLGRYDVVQNVYVKAAAANGAVNRDANGNVIVYRNNSNEFNYKGVADGGDGDVDLLATSQTMAEGDSSQDLVLTGTAFNAAGRIVTITSAGDDSARTFTVTGTDLSDAGITETISGANIGTATGSKIFKTVTGINVDGDTAGAVTAGINNYMSLTELTEANGYYEAVIVVDSLSDSQGGDGVDVLIGVEGLMFGHASSGDHEWLEEPSDENMGGTAAMHGGASLTKLSVSASGSDNQRDWDWVEGDPDAISSDGNLSSLNGVTDLLGTLGSRQTISITRSDTSTNTLYRIVGTGDDDWDPGTDDADLTQDIQLWTGMDRGEGWYQFSTITSITVVTGEVDGATWNAEADGTTITVGTGGNMVESTNYEAKYTGTNFDDIIFWNEVTEFKTPQWEGGNKFALNKVVQMSFDPGLGDDIVYGATDTSTDTPELEFSYVKYDGAKAEYDITLNNNDAGALESVTIKHKIPNSMGGTGIDTLYDIDAARFGSGSSETWAYFLPEAEAMLEWNDNAGREEISGYEIKGTEYAEVVLAAEYDDSVDQTIFFSPNGSAGGSGMDVFDGRNDGKDGLKLSGLFSRYDITYDPTSDYWTFVDYLPENKGGDGTVKAKYIDKVQFGGPFEIKIGSAFDGATVTNSSSDDVKVSVKREVETAGGRHKYSFGKFKELAGDGALLTSEGEDADSVVDDQALTTSAMTKTSTTVDLSTDHGGGETSGKYITVTFKSGTDFTGKTITVTGAGWDANGDKQSSIQDTFAGVDASGGDVVVVGSFEFENVASVTSSQNDSGKIDVGSVNEMFSPAGYETADHDGDGANPILITNSILYGSAVTEKASSLIDQIEKAFEADKIAGSASINNGATATLETGINGANSLWDAGKAMGHIVAITGSGDNSGITFTVAGTDKNDNASATEAITGVDNGTALGSTEWKSITSITVSGGNTDGAVSIGARLGALDANGVVTNEEWDYAQHNLGSSFFGGEDSGNDYSIEKLDNYEFNSFGETVSGTGAKLRFDFFGQGKDDVFYGSKSNDHFSGAPGDDIFWGQGEEKAEWWDTFNSGDKVSYEGIAARYTITKHTDTNTDSNTTWDTTGITIGSGSDEIASNAAPVYYKVVDSLGKLYGGDGEDILVDIEKIEFSDQMYSLKIQTIKNEWDVNTTILGTSGDDTISGSLTDDASSDTDYQINPGAGKDLVIGGIEPTDMGWVWGDTVVYDAQSKYFDISIKELSYALNEAKDTVTGHGDQDWDQDGDTDSDDTTIATDLFARFGGETINRVTATDERPADAGGLGVDTLYGIEHIEFRSGEFGDMFDLSPSSYKDYQGYYMDFWGTDFGDVFVGDAGSTWINSRGGDDWIIALDGADRIQPGAGADYVNAGANNDPSGSGDSWFRDEVNFWEVAYGRTEVAQIKVQVHDDTGDILLSSDEQFNVYAYTGEAAWAEDYEEHVNLNEYGYDFSTFTSGTAESGYSWVDAFLVTDTLPIAETGSIGINVLVGVEGIGFSDEFLDVQATSSSWSWVDWEGNTITESFKEGTPFDDTITGGTGTDTLSGNAGNDSISGAGGGDRLKGGKGHDFLDGGANGTSGDAWRDLDIAEYSGIEARYGIFKVAYDASATNTPGSTTIFDVGGKLEGALGLTDGSIVLDGYTVIKSDGSGSDYTDTAYVVMDYLPSDMGGSGNDLLTNVEQVQFQDSHVDLGLRIEKWDWDNDASNGYDWVEVIGTDGADDITSWDTTSVQDGDNEIRGKGGNDIIYGYAGGDRIDGGSGDDFIDGGADGITEFGWTPKDEALYSGPSKNYTITTYSKTDTALTDLMTELGITVSGWSNYADTQQFVVVKDALPSSMGGTGTDILTNVEFIGFQDQFLPLAKEEFIDVDPVTGLEVRRYVNGTSADDTIDGGVGNDDLFGNGGNDTISGGAGGDYITPGKGDDTIDGGADGTNQWDGSKIFDTVFFEGNYADYTIEDGQTQVTDAEGNTTTIQQITVISEEEGTDTLTNVETLQFFDNTIFVGVNEMQRTYWNGVEEVDGGLDIFGSIFGDTIQGSDLDDGIDGGVGADTIYGNDGPDWIKGGLGNDTIYGGKNGLDAWGNPGDDVAAYSGNMSQFTITYYDVDGNQSNSYQADGYVKVKDSRTDATVSEGTDTLYGIEGLEFWDDYLGFQKVETFIDLDGDGKPDVGGKKGTSSSDLLEGSDMDEKLEGKVGDDTLSGGNGDDTLIGGVGSDTLIGGNGGGNDTAIFEGAQANYTIAEVNKWVAHKADGTYETDTAGNPKIYDNVDTDNVEALWHNASIDNTGSITMNGTQAGTGASGADDAPLPGGKYFRCESEGDETGLVFTITGKDASGAEISDTVNAGNGIVMGDQLFHEITDVSVNQVSSGNVKLGAISFANADTIASKGYSVTTKDADADGTISTSEASGSDVVDYVFEMENLQFADGFGRTGIEINANDLDFDFEIDDAELLGDISSNYFGATSSDMQSLVPDWVVTEEGSAANALQTLFDADNFLDGGAGKDYIFSGGGDDTIELGARSGDAGDVVDGGEGDDILFLDGNQANWSSSTSTLGAYDLNGDGDTDDTGENDLSAAGYTKYTSNNGTSDDSSDDFFVYVKGIEAIEYDDAFAPLTKTEVEVDNDGDGKVDQVMVKGAAAAEAVLGSVIEGNDKDSVFAASTLSAAGTITLKSGDADGFYDNAISGAGELTLGGALITAGGLADGKLVAITVGDDGDSNAATGNEAVQFTITGTDLEGNALTEVVTGANNGTVNSEKVFATVEKVESSAAVGGGNVTVGTADASKLGDGQFVVIESKGDDSAVDFTVVGKDENGNVMTEVISGTNIGDAIGSKLFTEITSIESSAATADDITIGTISEFVSKEDFVDGGAGNDVISTGDGGDILIGGDGADFMFGGQNSGVDENGDPNVDVAKFNGRSTSVDLNGDGTISADESADFEVTQNGFIICNGMIDSNGVCILTTATTTKTDADADALMASQSSALSEAGTIAIDDADSNAGNGTESAVINSAVTITSGGDDSGITFTITGKDADGQTITETLTGGNSGAATGEKIFKTVTKVETSGATAGTIDVGTADKFTIAEDRIGDNEIDATTKPTIFTNAETAIAVKVANGYDADGDGQEDTLEVAGAADGVVRKSAVSGSGNSLIFDLTGEEASGDAVTLTEAQNVYITSYGDDSDITFTVTGLDASGTSITEVITGADGGSSSAATSAVATGIKLFSKITEIKASNATDANEVEIGLTSYYLDVDGDQMADTLESGNFQQDLNGDGDYTDTGEYQIALAADMTVDEIFCVKNDANGDGDFTDAGDTPCYQIFDGHEIRPVYEVKDLNSTDANDPTIDIVIEVEQLEFTDGKMKLVSESETEVTFSLADGISENVVHEGSNFADEIIAGASVDQMEGGGGADTFVFGNGTGADSITDFVATAVTNDSGTITTHADVIKVLKDVNGQSIDTASGLANRVTSTSNGALVDLGGGNTILLEGVNSDDLTAANFSVVEVL